MCRLGGQETSELPTPSAVLNNPDMDALPQFMLSNTNGAADISTVPGLQNWALGVD